jgi:hypothetical protein
LIDSYLAQEPYFASLLTKLLRTPQNSPNYPLIIKNFIQGEEILRHKWFLSQKERRDVGFDYAAMDFITRGLARKFSDHYNQLPQSRIERLSQLVAECQPPEEVHAVLGDYPATPHSLELRVAM